MPQSEPLLMQAIAHKSRWLQSRHAVLTENVANADTPGFQPNDLKEVSFASLVRAADPVRANMQMTRTSDSHLSAQALAPKVEGRSEFDGFETAPSGNAVVLEEQAFRLGETRAQYQLATGLYGKFIGLWRTALGAPGA